MDPITAGLEFGKALCELFTELVKGQTAEQKAKLWQQWIDFWAPLMPKPPKP